MYSSKIFIREGKLCQVVQWQTTI